MWVMSKVAWAYIWSILTAGVCLIVLSVAATNLAGTQPAIGMLFALLATLAHLYKAEGRDHQALYVTGIFWFAGLLLLEPFLFVLLIIVPHLVQWLKERGKGTTLSRIWYLQPFNVAMYIIAGQTAYFVYATLLPADAVVGSITSVLTMAVAAVSYLFVNQLILGLALVLARGLSWRETGVLSWSSLLPELIMLWLGASVATLWHVAPWLIPLVLSPLALIYQSLHIPKLKQEAQTDSKTGLLNPRYFAEKYGEELHRAQRFNRPLAFVMADLDYLRTINNTYGHLAGDTVLVGVAKIIRATVREYDWVGRFGGEEFAIILPETELDEAWTVATRVRQAIEAASFEIATADTPISATMSFGVACFPLDGTTELQLSHAADIAMYQAKAQGRNCVVCAAHLAPDALQRGGSGYQEQTEVAQRRP